VGFFPFQRSFVPWKFFPRSGVFVVGLAASSQIFLGRLLLPLTGHCRIRLFVFPFLCSPSTPKKTIAVPHLSPFGFRPCRLLCSSKPLLQLVFPSAGRRWLGLCVCRPVSFRYGVSPLGWWRWVCPRFVRSGSPRLPFLFLGG